MPSDNSSDNKESSNSSSKNSTFAELEMVKDNALSCAQITEEDIISSGDELDDLLEFLIAEKKVEEIIVDDSGYTSDKPFAPKPESVVLTKNPPLSVKGTEKKSFIKKMRSSFGFKGREDQEWLAQEKTERAISEKLRLANEKERKGKLEKSERAIFDQFKLADVKIKQENLDKKLLAKKKIEKEKLEKARIAIEKAKKAKLEQVRLAKEKADQERLEQARLVKEKAEQERLKQARLAEEKAEQEQLEQAHLAKEKAEQERLDQARLAKEKAEQERLDQARLAKEKAEQERLDQARLVKEKAEQERLEQIRLAKEKAEQDRLEQARLAKEKAEQEQLEQAHLVKEKTEQEQLEQARLAEEKAEQEQLEQARLAEEKAEQERLDQARLAKEKAEQERLEQTRLAKEKAEQERLEQERLDQARLVKEKAEQEKREQVRLAKEKAEQERLDQARLAKEKAEQERREQARLAKEKAEQEQLEQTRLAKEKAEQEKQEQARLVKEQTEQESLEQARLIKEEEKEKFKYEKEKFELEKIKLELEKVKFEKEKLEQKLLEEAHENNELNLTESAKGVGQQIKNIIPENGFLSGEKVKESNSYSNTLKVPVERNVQLCGENSDIKNIDLIRTISFNPNDFMLSMFMDKLELAKASHQLIQLKFNGVTIVIDHILNTIYCDILITDSKFYEVCNSPISSTEVVTHELSFEETKIHKNLRRDKLDYIHSIESFIWTTSLLTSHGRLPENTDVLKKIGLIEGLNLEGFESIPHAREIEKLLCKKQYNLIGVSKHLKISQRYVFAFYNATLSLNMIDFNTKTPVKKETLSKAKPSLRNLFRRK